MGLEGLLGADILHRRLLRTKSSVAETPDFGFPYVAHRAACQQCFLVYIHFLQQCRSILQDIVCHPPDRSLASFAHKKWRLVLPGAPKYLVEVEVLERLDIDWIG